LTRHRAAKKDFDITHRLLMSDGSVKFVHVLSRLLKDATGNLEIAGALVDVTENTRLYRDLTEREAKIRRLVEANIIGVFLGDFDGRILEANDAFLGIVGYDGDDFATGRLNWKDLTPRTGASATHNGSKSINGLGSGCRSRKNTCGKTAAAFPFCWARQTNLSLSCST
jgi:PAS domain-containing protein